MKSVRRKAREEALQILYQIELNHAISTEAALSYFKEYFTKKGEETDPFVKRLIQGVTENVKKIDTRLANTSEHWRMDRMAAVDRNILRLGIFELEYCDDIPATVSINEMIEIAKNYGSENSAAFINGILDKIKAELQIPGKAP